MKDLGSKIKVYSHWVIMESENPIEEIEYLVSLLLDDAPTRKKEMIDVLNFINERI